MNEIDYAEEKVVVISAETKRKGVFSVWFKSQSIVEKVKPGQFLTIQAGSDNDITPILRRPFAISDIDYATNHFEILFEVKGRGTELMAKTMTRGETFNVLAPLGNSFKSMPKKKKLLIAGGMGIAPIKMLLNDFLRKKEDVTLLWGNREKSMFFDLNSFVELDILFLLATDNGSMGFKGNTLDLLKSSIKNEQIGNLEDYDIFIVGPEIMMSSIAIYLEEQKVNCQISLEKPMACGIGVCQGCAVKKKDSDDYFLVCKDGPVFFANELNLKDL